MKNAYIIAMAVVVIVIVIGSVFAYTYLTRSPTSAQATKLAAATLTGNGGTLVAPIMTNWIGAYQHIQPQISITYNPVGSGQGVTDFVADGLGNFGESDAPMTTAQYAEVPSGSTVLTLPITASAVVPAYRLPLTNGSYCKNGLNFTGPVLAAIFMGNITKWNDPQIQNLQSPSVASVLPDTSILCVHRSDGSGTMFAFTDFLYDTSSAWASKVGPPSTSSSIWPVIPNEVTEPKNAGVAGYISTTNYAIGPLEISYILENPGETSLYYGTVENAAGNFILANDANIAATLQAGATAGLPAGNASWTTVSIIDNTYKDTTDTAIYPIVTMTYALVYEQQTNYAQGAALVNFFSWIVNSGQSYGLGEGYVALPANIVAVDNATLQMITYNNMPIA